MRFYLVLNIPDYPIEPHHLQEAINSVMRDHIQGQGNAIVRGNVSLLKIHQKGEEPLLLLSLLIVSQISQSSKCHEDLPNARTTSSTLRVTMSLRRVRNGPPLTVTTTNSNIPLDKVEQASMGVLHRKLRPHLPLNRITLT